MRKLIIISSLCLLSACGNNTGNTQTTVYSLANALTAADTVALQYVTMPLCGPTHPAPLCSRAEVSTQIKIYAQKAHDAVKAAEQAGDNASLAIANAAITSLVNATPVVN